MADPSNVDREALPKAFVHQAKRLDSGCLIWCRELRSLVLTMRTPAGARREAAMAIK